ncbi:MAG: YicC family protein [Chitinophagales bacterium]|nr:YicC family protein [Chitinophagales bacterium]
MLLSMTGYGRASGSFGDKTLTAEVRALNAKVTDVKLRLPADYKEKEIELRKLVTDHAERGKIDVLLEVQNADGAATVTLNEALFRGYHRELSRLSAELNIPSGEMLTALLRIPNVINASSGEMDEEEWVAVCETVNRAMDHLKVFRKQEGRVLEADLRLRVTNILLLLTEVTPFEQERFTRMRDRIRNNMEEGIGKENLDPNRFEQELLFYLEKMDMSEEKIRLEQHCKYFLEQLDGKQESLGRTLNFISQEIGREINTLGAKAYDADIQRIVVQMKDELEKMKEQIANVL